MKLTVLGCWAPYPRAGGACSGYLVQSGDKNILIDFGNGAFSNLQKHLDFRKLDAALVSHLHPDHYLDLHCLRHAIGGVRRLKPKHNTLPLYLPDNPTEPYNKMKGYTEAFAVTAIEQLPAVWRNGVEVRETRVGDVKVSFARTDHPLPTYALLIEGDGSLFYTADTKWSENLVVLAGGVDTVLSEASVIEEDREYTSVGHLTCRQAGQLAKQAGARQLVITHFWPEYNSDTIKAEAESGFNSPVLVAREGLEIVI